MARYIDASPYEDCRIVCNSEDEGVHVNYIAVLSATRERSEE